MLPNRDKEKDIKKEEKKISAKYKVIVKRELEGGEIPKEEKKKDIDERVEEARLLFRGVTEAVDRLNSFLDMAKQNLTQCRTVAEAKILEGVAQAITRLNEEVTNVVKTVPKKDWDDAMNMAWAEKTLLECQHLNNKIQNITQYINDKFKKEQAVFHEFNNLSHEGFNSVTLISGDALSDAAISKIPKGSLLMRRSDDGLDLEVYWYAGKISLKIESRSYLMCIGEGKNRDAELKNLIENEKLSDRDVYVYYFKVGNPNELYYVYIEHGKMTRIKPYDEEVVFKKECGFRLRLTKPNRKACSELVVNELYLHGSHDNDGKLFYMVKDSAGTIHKREITEGEGLEKNDIVLLKGLLTRDPLPKRLLHIKMDLQKNEIKVMWALFDIILERGHILEKDDYLSLRGRIEALWEGGQDKPYRMLDVEAVSMISSNVRLESEANFIQKVSAIDHINKSLPEVEGRSTDINLIEQIKAKFDGCPCPNYDDCIVTYGKARHKILLWMRRSIDSKASRIKEKKDKMKDTKMIDKMEQKLAMLKHLSFILGDVFRHADNNKFQEIVSAIEKGKIYKYTEKGTGIERELAIESKDVPREVMDGACWLGKYSLGAEHSEIANTFRDIYTLSKMVEGNSTGGSDKLHSPLDSVQGSINNNLARYSLALRTLPLIVDKVNRHEEDAKKMRVSLTPDLIENIGINDKGKEKEGIDIDLPKKATSWTKYGVSSPREEYRKKYKELAASGSPRSDRTTLRDSTSSKQKPKGDPWFVRSLPVDPRVDPSKRKGETGNGHRMERKEKAITSKYPENMPQLNIPDKSSKKFDTKPKVARTTSSKIINSRGIEKTLSSGGLFKGANTLDSSLSRSSKSGKTRRLAENRSTIFMPSTPGAPLDRHRGDRLRLDKKSSTKKLATQISPRNQDSSPKSPKSPKKT